MGSTVLEAARGGKSNWTLKVTYSSLASNVEAGSWGTSSTVIPWLGFEQVTSWKGCHHNPPHTQHELTCTSSIPHRSPCGLLAVSLPGKISFCSFTQLMKWIRNQISIVQSFQHYYMMASSDSWKAVEYLSKGAQWLAWLWWWAGCVHCKVLCALGWHRQKLRALTLLQFFKLLDGTRTDSSM